MNKFILFFILICLGHSFDAKSQSANDYFQTTVTFPADFKVGDFIEFASSKPISAEASGYYEVSIAYDRGYMAAAATHIVSSSHANPSRWLEAGRINNNIYAFGVGGGLNFTVDHNPGTKSFRIRAVATLGTSNPLAINIKIRSINFNTGYTNKMITGNEPNKINPLPMTYDWELIVGNVYQTDGTLAIKAIGNGYVGIGTPTPTERLSVNGKIRAQEIKVEAAPWPDYVFEENHPLMPLDELERFVKENKHLPSITRAKAVAEDGVALGELNRQLLQKIEEMTLYLIQQNKEIKELKEEVATLKANTK